MSPNRRNVMVGGVVLGGLLILAWMLIQFGGGLVTPFAAASIRVRFVADRADGISNGSEVLYRGVNVGRVDKVSRADDQVRIFIDALLDKNPPLPANLRAIIRSQGLLGSGSSLVLETTDSAPQGALTEGQQVEARFIGLDILPPEYAELARELQQTAKQFRESNVVRHLDEQVMKTGSLIDSLQSIIDDKQLRNDVKLSLENVRTTTEKADRIASNIEKLSGDLQKLSNNASDTLVKTQTEILSLSKQMSARLEQVSKVLDQFQSISQKINSGNGTAGALVNDPKLYQSLVDTSRELNAVVADLRRLFQQWEQEGVSIKMK